MRSAISEGRVMPRGPGKRQVWRSLNGHEGESRIRVKAGQRRGKVEPALWRRRRSHSPAAPRCLRMARYGRTARDLRRTGEVSGGTGVSRPISESEMASEAAPVDGRLCITRSAAKGAWPGNGLSVERWLGQRALQARRHALRGRGQEENPADLTGQRRVVPAPYRVVREGESEMHLCLRAD